MLKRFLACAAVLWLAWPTQASAVSLLQDPGFRLGLSIAAVEPATAGAVGRPRTEGRLQAAGVSRRPQWLLAQWGSRLSLTAGEAVDCPPPQRCRVVWHQGRELKAVVLGQGAAEFDLQLRSDGLAEFSGRHPGRSDPYLRRGEMWPHLLVSQPLRSRSLAEYRQLPLTFEARLDYDQEQRQSGYQPGLHAARFVIALTLRNRFTRDYLWLMLPVYDDRYPQSPFGCRKCLPGPDGEPDCLIPLTAAVPGQWQCPRDLVRSDDGPDLGTARLLFRVPAVAMRPEPLSTGQWVRHRIDLRPWLLEALQAAVDQGEPGFAVRPEDFTLAAINLGWELSGLNRVSLSLRGLELQGLR